MFVLAGAPVRLVEADRSAVVEIDDATDGIEIGDDLPLEMDAISIALKDPVQFRFDRVTHRFGKVAVIEAIAEIIDGADLDAQVDEVLNKRRNLVGGHRFQYRLLRCLRKATCRVRTTHPDKNAGILALLAMMGGAHAPPRLRKS